MIYIASCYFQNNYGSVLQAYATQKVLEQLGVENRTICYDGISSYINRRKIKYYAARLYRFDAFAAQCRRYSLKFRKKLDKRYAADIVKRETAFRRFIGERFALTEPCDFDGLARLCGGASAVIAGSDQLWLPSNIHAGYFTLSFVPDGVRRISYATSFGVSRIDKKTQKRCKGFLEKFDCISVRENSGERIIEEITGKPCDVVCDPTLLLGEAQWMAIQRGNRIYDEKYIFCYFLGDNKWQREWAAELKRTGDLKVVALIHLDEYIGYDGEYADYTPFDISPGDFVNLIRHAEYVCTDSFHATAFSVIHRKKFFTFRRFCRKHSASTNSRLDSLLSGLGLTNRIIGEEVTSAEAAELPIDYDDISEKIETLKNESIKWLGRAIGVQVADG
jgi:hypothetical protein